VGGAEKVLEELLCHFSRTNDVALICPEPDIFKEIDPGKIKIITNNIRHHFDIGRLLALKKAVSNIDPDLIILNLSSPYSCVHMSLISLLFFKQKKKLYIVNAVSAARSNFPLIGQIRKLLASFIFDRADKLVFHSQASYRTLKDNYPIRNKNIEIVHCGFNVSNVASDQKISEIKKRHGLGNGKVVGVVGRLVPEKGIETVIKAFNMMCETDDNMNLLIVGDGKKRSDYEKQANLSGVASNIIFTGYVDSVEEYISVCDVIVLPSEYETISLVLGQAMALGKPVIATNVGGMPELAGDAVKLIPPNDAKIMSEAVLGLLASKSQMDNLGKNAQQRIKEKFTKAAMYAQYEKLLNIQKNVPEPSFLLKALFYSLICGPALIKAALRRSAPSKRESFIIFQLGHLGDLILSEPFLRNLRKNNEGKKITLVVGPWNRILAESIPWIDDVLIFDNYLYSRNSKLSFFSFLKQLIKFLRKVNRAKYDVGIDLRGHINSLYLLYLSNIKELIGFSYAKQGLFLDKKIPFRDDVYESDRLLSLFPLLGYKIHDSEIKFDLDEADLNKAKTYLKQSGVEPNEKLIMVFPGAPYLPRRWPINNFALLLDTITEKGLGRPIVVGGKKDQAVVKSVIAAAKHPPAFWVDNDLMMLAALISLADVFISNDTGPMHLAVALSKPTIALFGPGNYQRWAPKQGQNISIKAQVDCSPCKLTGDVCANPTINCMEKIALSEVMQAMKVALDRGSTHC